MGRPTPTRPNFQYKQGAVPPPSLSLCFKKNNMLNKKRWLSLKCMYGIEMNEAIKAERCNVRGWVLGGI